ncbi:hypothetical protein J3459_010900 [Metarhizium acridum]|uniref:Chitinase n=1 Tax=Metarhizium acridum (strain CQMa 102) TaxID=655827 RepID=E9EBS9_METAQ|nr:chitinase [Metarhizium acridum CQMa 102]EFY86638.1 chitinase [Metarhizium acridum CQMa 102]KAG8408583.1 hypothetical protein J3458_019614 [Metarhizium acridum]KAG8420616.1 hypothetical protein J3459_010900 [Metarhizium acridum]
MKLVPLLLATTASAAATIARGRGYGTYYYDVEQMQACGYDFAAENKGPVECSFTQPLPLGQMRTNYLVAMNHTELRDNLDKYCGKRVVVTVDGVRSALPLFIGDGCERCGGGLPDGAWDSVGAPGLDFSYTVLSELAPQACAAGHVDLSWEILDENLYHFTTH